MESLVLNITFIFSLIFFIFAVKLTQPQWLRLLKHLICGLLLIFSIAICLDFLKTNSCALVTTKNDSEVTPDPEEPIQEPFHDETVQLHDDEIPAINKTTSGEILQDEIWRDEILISGDIAIPSGASLTIEPGTTVKFTAFSDDRNGGPDKNMAEIEVFPDDLEVIPAKMISIDVKGTLIAKGTKEKPITFTSNSPNPKYNDWQSISIHHSAQLIFENAVLEYCYWGIQLKTENTDCTISDSVFRHLVTGIIVRISGGKLTVKNCSFSYCKHEGIDIAPEIHADVKNNLFFNSFSGINAQSSNVLIDSNTCKNNNLGMVIMGGGSPRITGNLITRNNTGIIIHEGSKPEITDNNIFDNERNVSLLKNRENINAEKNWWGSTFRAEIEKLNNDGRNLPGLGLIDYDPIALNKLDIKTPEESN